jgi:hypothetical protein
MDAIKTNISSLEVKTKGNTEGETEGKMESANNTEQKITKINPKEEEENRQRMLHIKLQLSNIIDEMIREKVPMPNVGKLLNK